MPYRVSIASGNFGDPATWSGGNVPTVGDRFEIAANHVVEVTDARDVGDSPNDQTTIVAWIRATSTTAGARLIIRPTGHLRVRGNLAVDNSQTSGSVYDGLIVEGRLTFDPSSSGGSPMYVLMCGSGNGSRASVRIAGTSKAARGIIEAEVGHRWRFAPVAHGSGTILHTYPDGSTGNRQANAGSVGNLVMNFARLVRMGSGTSQTNSAMYHASCQGPANVAGADLEWDDCGVVWGASPSTGNSFYFDRSFDVTARAGGQAFRIPGGGTGTRRVSGVVRGQIQVDTSNNNVTLDDVIWIHGTPSAPVNSPPIAVSTSGKAASWKRCTIYWHTGSNGSVPFGNLGDLEDSLVLRDGSSGNPHWIVGTVGHTTTMRRNFFEHVSLAGGSGDALLSNGNTAWIIEFENNIFGRCGSGGWVGCLNIFGNNNTARYRFRHNTFWVGGATGLISLGETPNSPFGTANQIAEFKSNLLVSTNAYSNQNWIGYRYASYPTQDGVDQSQWSHNVVWGLSTTGTAAPGWQDLNSGSNTWFTGPVPGQPGSAGPDTNVDPALVGWGSNGDGLTGSFLKWGQTLDGSLASGYAVVERMASEAAGDITAGYTSAAALAWLRTHYAPTNTAIRDAGHDGVTVGAVEGVWPSNAGDDAWWWSRLQARRRQTLRAALIALALHGAWWTSARAQETVDTVRACRYELYWSTRREAVLAEMYRRLRLERDSLRAELARQRERAPP